MAMTTICEAAVTGLLLADGNYDGEEPAIQQYLRRGLSYVHTIVSCWRWRRSFQVDVDWRDVRSLPAWRGKPFITVHTPGSVFRIRIGDSYYDRALLWLLAYCWGIGEYADYGYGNFSVELPGFPNPEAAKSADEWLWALSTGLIRCHEVIADEYSVHVGSNAEPWSPVGRVYMEASDKALDIVGALRLLNRDLWDRPVRGHLSVGRHGLIIVALTDTFRRGFMTHLKFA